FHVERLDCLIDLGVDFSHRGLQSHSLDTERLRSSWAAAFLIPCVDITKRPAAPLRPWAPDSRTAPASGRRTAPSAGVSAHTVERYGFVTPKARSSDHRRQRGVRQNRLAVR